MINAGMPNLRKNPFSTDLYCLFQSTDKTMIYGRIYGFFLLGPATTPPHCTSRSRYSTGKKRFFDESTDFFMLSSATMPPLDSRYFARAE